jgi:hypothetical protein
VTFVFDCGRHDHLRDARWQMSWWCRLGSGGASYGFVIGHRRGLLFSAREVMRFVPLWGEWRLVILGWRRKGM